MPTIDAAIDDYLHLIIRTRPWTKAHEEAQLMGMVEWIYAQPAQDRGLAAADTELVDRYVAATELSAAESDELTATLARFNDWAAAAGLLPGDRRTSHAI